MSDREIPPLPPDLRDLVDEERALPAAPAAGRARVRTALETSLFGPPSGGANGGGDEGSGGAGASGTAGGAARSVRLGSLGMAAIAGAVAGAALTYGAMSSRGSLATPAVTTATTAVSVPDSSDSPGTAPSAAVSFAAPAATSEPTPSPSATSTRRDASSDSASAERAILDPARAALSRGDASSALDAARAHEAAFPAGKLTEEREAIAVQALVRLHRGAEAKWRGARFLAKYPSSVLGPVVQAALANAD